MSSNVHVMVVQTGVGRNHATTKVEFKKYHGQWYVKAPGDGDFHEFADGEAGPDDVRQLIRKEYDVRY